MYYETDSQPVIDFTRTKGNFSTSYTGDYYREVAGSYSLQVKKVNHPTTATARVSGAKISYSLNNDQKRNGESGSFNTSSTSDMYLNMNADSISNRWTKNQSNSNIKITTTTSDQYQLQESTPPTGYKSNVYSGTIGIKVNKKIENNTYKVKDIELYQGDIAAGARKIGNTITLQSEAKTYYISFANNTLSYSTTAPSIDNQQQLDRLVGKITVGSGGGITFSFYNEKITGSYTLQVKKVNHPTEADARVANATISYSLKNDQNRTGIEKRYFYNFSK